MSSKDNIIIITISYIVITELTELKISCALVLMISYIANQCPHLYYIVQHTTTSIRSEQSTYRLMDKWINR